MPGPGIILHSDWGTRDGTHNLSMCPDQELNLLLFSYWVILHATEPHQPGQKNTVIIKVLFKFVS